MKEKAPAKEQQQLHLHASAPAAHSAEMETAVISSSSDMKSANSVHNAGQLLKELFLKRSC